MRAIIAGCGRVGAQLAGALAADGHDVVVIDKNGAAFDRIEEGFSGETLKGIVFDQATLERAGIRKAQAFVAVTSGDNSNIVAARTAKERYGVERVICRIYDPPRAEIFERLGVTVIATAQWTAESVLRLLAGEEERIEGTVGTASGDVVMVAVRVPATCHGVEISALNRPGQSVLAAITRAGNTTVPAAGALLEAGDLVHLAVERGSLAVVRRAVGLLGEEPA
ncbi:MAG: TrkA family potassium uptake protein [Nitriliruptorales bacterium]|nr:TrkA family potassium uptake protein [Nitriliruptorales bacterium]